MINILNKNRQHAMLKSTGRCIDHMTFVEKQRYQKDRQRWPILDPQVRWLVGYNSNIHPKINRNNGQQLYQVFNQQKVGGSDPSSWLD